MAPTRQGWIDLFVAQLVLVVGALTDHPASSAPSSDLPDDGWVATLRAEGGVAGSLSIEFGRSATEALTKRIMALEIAPPDAMVVDTIKEICGQAASAAVQEAGLAATSFVIESIQLAALHAGPAGETSTVSLSAGQGEPLRLRFWGELAAAIPGAGSHGERGAMEGGKFDVILDIDLPLVVRFGRTEMQLRSLAALGPGSVIDLGRPPDEVVDVLVGAQIVARGEVVVVGGNYGVRITDIVSPADRMRSMEVQA